MREDEASVRGHNIITGKFVVVWSRAVPDFAPGTHLCLMGPMIVGC